MEQVVTLEGAETTLHFFTDRPDGKNPSGGLVFDTQGNLYGTTESGGAYSQGTVFEVTPIGTETVVHSFRFHSPPSAPPLARWVTDGKWPVAGLVLDTQGNLYGTTMEGGLYSRACQGCGTVFEVTPTGSEKVLYSFERLSE